MEQASEPPRVEIVYALPERQRVVSLPLRDGMTALEAVEASGLLAEFPGLEGTTLPLGIHGRRVEGWQPLRAGDRVEIYRPLGFDPRAARRRAAQVGTQGRRPRARPG